MMKNDNLYMKAGAGYDNAHKFLDRIFQKALKKHNSNGEDFDETTMISGYTYLENHDQSQKGINKTKNTFNKSSQNISNIQTRDKGQNSFNLFSSDNQNEL